MLLHVIGISKGCNVVGAGRGSGADSVQGALKLS